MGQRKIGWNRSNKRISTMRMTYRASNDRVTFELDVPHGKAAFECIAGIEALFGEESCGCCKSEKIVHEVREVKEGKYFSIRCKACGAQLDYCQNRDNIHLFAKRWNKETNSAMPNNG